MKTIFTILMCIGITISPVLADDSEFLSKFDGQIGKGFFNGRYWTQLSDDSKTMYLAGLVEGIQLVTMQLDFEDRTRVAKNVVCSYQNQEISPLIDELYDDTLNLAFPINVAYSLVVLKANGALPEEYERAVSQSRSIWK